MRSTKSNKMQSETMPAGPRKKDQTNEPFYDFNVRGEIWECATGCRSLLVNHFMCWMVCKKCLPQFDGVSIYKTSRKQEFSTAI